MRAILSILLLQAVALTPASATGLNEPSHDRTIYYIDSVRGSDDQDGTAVDSPWKSLAKLDGIQFNPGDQIMLKAGCRFPGNIHPQGSGVEGKPIVIDRYGDGDKPIVAGMGKVENTIHLHNQHHWEIRNLTVTNTDGGSPWDDEGRAIRQAIYVTATDAGEVRHIHLQSLEIRDVRGIYHFEGHETNGGIICQIMGDKKETRFLDLRIENCTFHTKSIDRYPAVVSSSWKQESACEVVWKNNTLDHAGRAHIVIPAEQWPRDLIYWNPYSACGRIGHALDLPIMRVSTVYNWREAPIISRDKNGEIKRNDVIYQRKGFPFNG